MKRPTYFAYAVSCHLLFLATYAWLACFVGNLFVPHSIDSPPSASAGWSATINLLLIGLFALQHSVMARPAFKEIWTRIVPHPIERSTYVLASCVVTALLIWQWRPITAVIWDAPPGILRSTLTVLFAAGWLMVPAVTLMINHFDLFGTRQAWLYFQGREYTNLPFRVPMLYKWVRHPLYVGWALAFWATPTMTWGHALFAGALTAYMGLASIVEERDLIAHFGRRYIEYRQQVPRFIPQFGRPSPQALRQLETVDVIAVRPDDIAPRQAVTAGERNSA